jgi:hypothetical protein
MKELQYSRIKLYNEVGNQHNSDVHLEKELPNVWYRRDHHMNLLVSEISIFCFSTHVVYTAHPTAHFLDFCKPFDTDILSLVRISWGGHSDGRMIFYCLK